MKRILFLLTVVLSLLIFSGCGNVSQISQFRIENGAYTCTPQELINILNKTAKNNPDTDYIEIPSYIGSGSEIALGDRLSITLKENENGKLNYVELHWNAFGITELESNSFSFYLGCILGLLSPDNAQQIVDSLHIFEISSGLYMDELVDNGTKYEIITNTGVSYMKIYPK